MRVKMSTLRKENMVCIRFNKNIRKKYKVKTGILERKHEQRRKRTFSNVQTGALRNEIKLL